MSRRAWEGWEVTGDRALWGINPPAQTPGSWGVELYAFDPALTTVVLDPSGTRVTAWKGEEANEVMVIRYPGETPAILRSGAASCYLPPAFADYLHLVLTGALPLPDEQAPAGNLIPFRARRTPA